MVPSASDLQAVLDAANSVEGIEVESTDGATVISAVASDPSRIEIRLTFDTSEGRLLRERRVAHGPVAGLALDPPIVMFDREIVVSEDLQGWEPSD
jgi:hypothetical protein